MKKIKFGGISLSTLAVLLAPTHLYAAEENEKQWSKDEQEYLDIFVNMANKVHEGRQQQVREFRGYQLEGSVMRTWSENQENIGNETIQEKTTPPKRRVFA